MPERVFLSFADSGLRKSLNRIHKQAMQINAFDRIITLDERALNPAFREEFQKHLKRGSRGYGYWCWKPQIILQTLEDMRDGDTLLYVDAGCHINLAGRNRLLEYFNEIDVAESGVVGFQAKPPNGPLIHDGRELEIWQDKTWTKGDLIDFLGVRDDTEILCSPTTVATIILFRKCPKAVELAQKWRAVFSSDFSLIDDTPSNSPNYPDFIEHRHDQACFSILSKLAGVQTLSAFEMWYPLPGKPGYPDWEALSDFPFHAKRDKLRSRYSKRLTSIQKLLDKIPNALNRTD